jgi:hypothetical protein
MWSKDMFVIFITFRFSCTDVEYYEYIGEIFANKSNYP